MPSKSDVPGKSLEVLRVSLGPAVESAEDLQWDDVPALDIVAAAHEYEDQDLHGQDYYWHGHPKMPLWGWRSAGASKFERELLRAGVFTKGRVDQPIYSALERAPGDPYVGIIRSLKFARGRATAVVRSAEDAFLAEWRDLRDPEVDADRLQMDIDYIMRRLGRLVTRRNAENWLRSFNDSLGGRPMDLVAQGATSDVLRAIDRLEYSAY